MSTSAVRYSSSNTQEEYDRLRSLANREAEERRKFSRLSTEAYASGDHLRAKELSEKGKRHGKRMRKYNRLARNCIYALNNPIDQPSNLIDLHGLQKKESERILLRRMAKAKAAGEEKITVIVGIGNNSINGPVIKPAVEKICQERGLAYFSEDGNKGRIVILLEDYEPENGDALGTSGSERDEETTSFSRAIAGSSGPRVHHTPPHNPRVSPYSDRPSPPPDTVSDSASLSVLLNATRSTPLRPPQAPPSRTYRPSQAPRTAQSSTNPTPSYQPLPSQHRPLNPIAPVRPRAPLYPYGRYDEEAAGKPAEKSSGFWGKFFKGAASTLAIGLVWYFLF